MIKTQADATIWQVKQNLALESGVLCTSDRQADCLQSQADFTVFTNALGVQSRCRVLNSPVLPQTACWCHTTCTFNLHGLSLERLMSIVCIDRHPSPRASSTSRWQATARLYQPDSCKNMRWRPLNLDRPLAGRRPHSDADHQATSAKGQVVAVLESRLPVHPSYHSISPSPDARSLSRCTCVCAALNNRSLWRPRQSCCQR